MAAVTWIKNELAQHHVAYEELRHPAAYTAQAMARGEHVSGHRVAKVVVAIAQGEPLELVLPASRRVSFDLVGEALGTPDVRLATEDEIESYFTDCEMGAIPPFRHWQGVDVLMDASLKVDGDIILQAGTHRDALRMNFADWFALVQPRIGSFSEPDFGRPEFRF